MKMLIWPTASFHRRAFQWMKNSSSLSVLVSVSFSFVFTPCFQFVQVLFVHNDCGECFSWFSHVSVDDNMRLACSGVQQTVVVPQASVSKRPPVCLSLSVPPFNIFLPFLHHIPLPVHPSLPSHPSPCHLPIYFCRCWGWGGRLLSSPGPPWEPMDHRGHGAALQQIISYSFSPPYRHLLSLQTKMLQLAVSHLTPCSCLQHKAGCTLSLPIS